MQVPNNHMSLKIQLSCWEAHVPACPSHFNRVLPYLCLTLDPGCWCRMSPCHDLGTLGNTVTPTPGSGLWCEDSQAVYIDPPRPSPPHNITLGLIKLKIQFPSPPSRQWCYSYRRRPLAPPGHSLCSVWEGKLRHKETYMTFLLNSIFCPTSVAKSNSNYWNY